MLHVFVNETHAAVTPSTRLTWRRRDRHYASWQDHFLQSRMDCNTYSLPYAKLILFLERIEGCADEDGDYQTTQSGELVLEQIDRVMHWSMERSPVSCGDQNLEW